MEQSVRVITIDGPAASGKGTVAERIAHELGFHYLDSGALYRLATYRALKLGTPLDDAEALERVASSMAPVFEQGRILLDGEDVTLRIRTEEVSRATSRVAAVPGVRKALFDLQRRAAFCLVAREDRAAERQRAVALLPQEGHERVVRRQVDGLVGIIERHALGQLRSIHLRRLLCLFVSILPHPAQDASAAFITSAVMSFVLYWFQSYCLHAQEK